MEDTLNQKPGEEEVLDPSLNQGKGDGNPDEEEEEFEIDFGDDDADDEEDKKQKEVELLALVNSATGKDFKSIDGLSKTIKQMDVDNSRRGEVKETVTPTPQTPEQVVPSGISERLLVVEQPLAKMVISELRTEAERSGRDIYDVWSGSQFFQQEAKVRYQNHKNKTRVATPGAPLIRQRQKPTSIKWKKNLSLLNLGRN